MVPRTQIVGVNLDICFKELLEEVSQSQHSRYPVLGDSLDDIRGIHKNLKPAEQAKEVAKVKRFESGVLRDPITISPEMTVRQVIALSREHGFSGFPVLQGKTVVGIITNRDLRFEEDLDATVKAKMTPRERLITVKEGASLEDAKRLMSKHRLERVLVVNDAFELRGLVTVKDILKATEHPNAAKDSEGKLRGLIG